jgi:hypothetical protein
VDVQRRIYHRRKCQPGSFLRIPCARMALLHKTAGPRNSSTCTDRLTLVAGLFSIMMLVIAIPVGNPRPWIAFANWQSKVKILK